MTIDRYVLVNNHKISINEPIHAFVFWHPKDKDEMLQLLKNVIKCTIVVQSWINRFQKLTWSALQQLELSHMIGSGKA